MRNGRVVVVGSGIGGLVAALRLACSGFSVLVCERAATAGGKLREIRVEGRGIDSGPTVLTLRDVFDGIFADAGGSFADAVPLEPLDVLARHAWTGGQQLDLFTDPARSADAIGAFAGPAEARGYLDFCERAGAMFRTLDGPFIRSSRPSLPGLLLRVGPRRIGALAGISPFTTLARALEAHFADPRLRQLFGRYATYCGSSPFLAPATLMLVADVESRGVSVIEGGMYRLVEAMVGLAEGLGVAFRYGAEVTDIPVRGGAAAGIGLAGGEVAEADAVVVNADTSAFGAMLLGQDVARAAPRTRPEERSLSALTWSLVGEPEGCGLLRHTVFFSDDYAAEFDQIRRGRAPSDPTVYVCAQDRGEAGEGSLGPERAAGERLFMIVNAPANGDSVTYDAAETSSCERRTFHRLERCGLTVRARPGSSVATTPTDFARLFPGTGGALYGPASHGWMTSFRRPGSRTRIAGLYAAGGSTHPGPGVPMAALSGTLAAASVAEDLASTSLSRRAATRGGMSMR